MVKVKSLNYNFSKSDYILLHYCFKFVLSSTLRWQYKGLKVGKGFYKERSLPEKTTCRQPSWHKVDRLMNKILVGCSLRYRQCWFLTYWLLQGSFSSRMLKPFFFSQTMQAQSFWHEHLFYWDRTSKATSEKQSLLSSLSLSPSLPPLHQPLSEAPGS